MNANPPNPVHLNLKKGVSFDAKALDLLHKRVVVG